MKLTRQYLRSQFDRCNKVRGTKFSIRFFKGTRKVQLFHDGVCIHDLSEYITRDQVLPIGLAFLVGMDYGLKIAKS